MRNEKYVLFLCETEVLASGGDGREDLLTKYLVALIFGKIEFYLIVSLCWCNFRKIDLRLKHVCELGSLSLLP